MIEFGLEANARDSIRQVVEFLAWKDIRSSDARLKHAIDHVAHAIELLFKARINLFDPSLVWINANHPSGQGRQSISATKAMALLTSRCGLSFSAEDEANLRELRHMRNAIQHHSWTSTEKAAKAVLADALSFILDFASTELKIDQVEEIGRAHV